MADADHQAAAREVQRLMAVYRDIEDMLTIGAYKMGANADCDLAIRSMPKIRELLAQRIEADRPGDRRRWSGPDSQTTERHSGTAPPAEGRRRSPAGSESDPRDRRACAQQYHVGLYCRQDLSHAAGKTFD